MNDKLKRALEFYYKESITRNAQRYSGEDLDSGYDRAVDFGHTCETLIELLIKDHQLEAEIATATAVWEAEGWNYDITDPEELPEW